MHAVVYSSDKPCSIWYDICGQAFFTVGFTVWLLVSVALFTLFERKVIASIQRRQGPNVVGPWGLLQPAADGLKLLAKEVVVPTGANTFLFILSPYITFVASLMAWGVIPFGPYSILADVPFSLLYVLAVSSIGVYGILLAGWASNSKYALIGAVRAGAQVVSYEVVLGFCILMVVLKSGSLSLVDIVQDQSAGRVWNAGALPSACILFFIAMLAETNRAPFDLPEAEAELVSGYNVEYSSMTFALFFLGEYSNMLCMSALWVVLFWGGWDSPISAWVGIGGLCSSSWWFGVKVVVSSYLFVLVRAVLPRIRYDALVQLCWGTLTPLCIFFLLLYLRFFASVLCLSPLPLFGLEQGVPLLQEAYLTREACFLLHPSLCCS